MLASLGTRQARAGRSLCDTIGEPSSPQHHVSRHLMDSAFATNPASRVARRPSFCSSLAETLSAPLSRSSAKTHTVDDAMHAAAVLAPQVALLEEAMSDVAHSISEWTNTVIVPTRTDDLVPHADHLADDHGHDAGLLQVVMRLAAVAPPLALAAPGGGDPRAHLRSSHLPHNPQAPPVHCVKEVAIGLHTFTHKCASS